MPHQQYILSFEYNFPVCELWFSSESFCGLTYFLSYTKVVAHLHETSTSLCID